MVQLTDPVRTAPARGRPSVDTGRQRLLAALLLTGLAGAAYAQGAFYPRGQAWLAVLLTAAGCLALTIRPNRHATDPHGTDRHTTDRHTTDPHGTDLRGRRHAADLRGRRHLGSAALV
ncbi:MAG TPA: hypothetical protein VFU36_10635, partial [Jatrophihabitans sp.]|nr:hypothetical protein [Jatrophihabitans sp.]